MCALDEWSDEKSCVKEKISLREKIIDNSIRYHRLNQYFFLKFLKLRCFLVLMVKSATRID